MAEPTILIVDDEEINIKLMHAFLMKAGYHLVSALDGERALTMVADLKPDLILLDVMMPGIDGLEVCRRIKRDEKMRMIPVVIVTALNEKEYRIKALEAGADDFLGKPVERSELTVRVKSLLRIKFYQDVLLKNNQEIHEKNERLQELEKIKDGLTHMIVHDMRNPLTALSLNLELFLIENKDITEAQSHAIRNSIQYCSETKQMVDDLLDINKMEETEIQLDKETTDLKDLIHETLGPFSLPLENKEISLSVNELAEGQPILIDRSLMKRVFGNLINNAIRHTPKNGHIDVLLGGSENGFLCASVKDNGTGLPPEFQERIFNKFEQASLKKAGIKPGRSGLGLTFCKLAVEAHGGKIWVESKGEGEGCTFNVAIPV